MTSKIYEPSEAKKIKDRIDSISLVKKNKKANSRRSADEIKENLDLERLLNHDDKLYFEEVFNSIS
jgi:hypothetical protein